MKKGVYTEKAAEDFLKKYVPVAKNVLSKKYEDIQKFAKKHDYNVVLKIISPQALHKSDIGGVIPVKSEEELKEAHDKLTKISKKKKLKLQGLLCQEFIDGKYLIVGIKKDPTFGHAIMVGLGGIFVEIMKDVSFRVCPITEQDAEEMLEELKGKALLKGARGQKPLNTDLLIQTLVKISKIPIKHPEIEELDINPFVLNDIEVGISVYWWC